MATDETRRPRPDPTAPDPVPGPGRTNGERPTGADGGRPAPSSNPWALNESRSGSAPAANAANGSVDTPAPDYGDSEATTALSPAPLDPATTKMAALPGPPIGRPPMPAGNWPRVPPQGGPPRAWAQPGPAYTWGPAGPVSAWPPPPPGPSSPPKGPSNTALAWLLAGVVTLAGGLLLWATRSSDAYVAPPDPVSEFSSSSSQLPAAPPPPPVAAPSVAPTTSSPPPPIRRVAPAAPVRTPIRTTPTTKVTTKPSATKTSKETSTKTSKPKSSQANSGSNDDNNNNN